VVLIFFFYYVVFATSHISGIIVCAISLGVYSSGSLMNIFTVHLNQVDRNQHAAAEMLGLTGWKKYRYVILPQAVKPMLPLIGAECKVLLRATTFAGYISELDLVKVTEIIRNQTYDVLVPLLLVSVIFLILSHFIVEGLSAIYNKAFKYDQN
jgi:ABC-type amino acid transport system permease subunit